MNKTSKFMEPGVYTKEIELIYIDTFDEDDMLASMEWLKCPPLPTLEYERRWLLLRHHKLGD